MPDLTGTNNIPLAFNRRFGRSSPEPAARTSALKQEALPAFPYDYKSTANVDKLAKLKDEKDRGRSQTRQNDDGKKRKRGNRWGDADDNNAVAGLIGLPTAILTQMTSEQLEAYTIHLRIEEISQKIKIRDIVPPERIRCVV